MRRATWSFALGVLMITMAPAASEWTERIEAARREGDRELVPRWEEERARAMGRPFPALPRDRVERPVAGVIPPGRTAPPESRWLTEDKRVSSGEGDQIKPCVARQKNGWLWAAYIAPAPADPDRRVI